MSQDRATFQKLAEARLAEARLLLASGLPSGALIAAQFRASEIPDRRLVERVHVHDLSKLLSLTGLEDELEAEMNVNPDLHGRWTTIKTWSERARYEIWTPQSASAILEAVGGDEGLLRWLQNR
jgi:hypothetical protein